MRHVPSIPVIAGAAFAILGTVPALATPVTLAPHRAVYDIALDEADPQSGIEGIYGRMVYEMRGSACAGYAVKFRFLTRIDTEDFSRVTDQRTTSFEDIEKGTFRFATKSYVDETLDQETRGRAINVDGSVAVELGGPDGRSMTLDPGHFPSAHMLEMIAKAKAGENFYQSHIYDGSEEGDAVMLTTAVIGEKTEPEAGGEVEAAAALADDPYWPVTVAYFNEGENGDETPTYQIAFKLYDNGVTRDMTMDYGNFSLHGQLAGLELFEPEACDGPTGD